VYIYTPDMVLADKMRMSESSQNSAARLFVNLVLYYCLQNKPFVMVLNLLQNKCAITIL